MKQMIVLLMLAACQQLSAEGFKTTGDGKTYSLQLLSAMEGTGVKMTSDDSKVYYTLSNDVTIAEGDKFVMDDGVTVLFDDGVTLTVEGEADFELEEGSTFDSASHSDETSPVGVRIGNEESQTTVENCTFRYVGLRCTSSKGLQVSMLERGMTMDKDCARTMYECLLCGACTNDCATGFDPLIFIREARTQANVLDLVPPGVQKVIDRVLETGNVYGAKVPKVSFEGIPAAGETLVWLGATARYAVPETAEALFAILKKASVAFAALNVI